MIVPDVGNPFFTLVVRGAEEAAWRAGYHVILCNTQADLERERGYVEDMLAFQVDGNYLSSFWFNLGDTPAVQQSGYGIANARINYSPASGKWEIGASVENLADKHYGTMGFDNTSINGLAQVYPGMPRWFKAHINYHF